MRRRSFLQAFGAATALTPLIGSGLLMPQTALATDSGRAAFEAQTALDALRQLGAGAAEQNAALTIRAPEIAENGAAVPIEGISTIPGTTSLSVLVDKNPFPLVVQFSFGPEVQPRFQTRIKMAESSRLRLVATAGGRFYTVFRDVKVTVGGCGA
ncbi:MAG: thiosulfate oxidation carrier protein SoxY [Proteobacteria bacterium]|nr:thiosulfate oxidation carrier protein SoxY [Pseudomonadota bacterium]